MSLEAVAATLRMHPTTTSKYLARAFSLFSALTHTPLRLSLSLSLCYSPHLQRISTQRNALVLNVLHRGGASSVSINHGPAIISDPVDSGRNSGNENVGGNGGGENNAGSSDEDDDDEEEASTSSHHNQRDVANALNCSREAGGQGAAAATNERTPIPLIDYILNVMKFVDAILSNNSTDDHCREFVTQGGLQPLLRILSLPNLPVDSPITASAQAVAAVCKSILVSIPISHRVHHTPHSYPLSD